MRLLRARGIESEAQIPFASLLELIRPALVMLDKIPAPQAAALEGALALRPGAAQERFAVGAATLSLLAAYAEEAPVAVLVDDAHWLDGSSAQALLFAFRRLVADPIAVLIAVREGEPSLLDGADLPTLRVGGLTSDEAATLLPGLPPAAAARLHGATAGNPLALLELAPDAQDLALAPEGAPLLVSAQDLGRVPAAGRRARRRRPARSGAGRDQRQRRSGDARAGRGPTRDRPGRAGRAPRAPGWSRCGAGAVEFRHPLARSAIYADAPAGQRRAAHRALAAALPDRDVDRRAWHLAAAAVGTDEAASAALEQAGARGRDRSAYATAAAAFERAGRLTADGERRAPAAAGRRPRPAGSPASPTGRSRCWTRPARSPLTRHMLVEIDQLAGHIATRRGPVMRGHAILTAAAERADPERAVAMLAEAASACFYAGNPAEMLAVAERARAALPASASVRARFLAAMAARDGTDPRRRRRRRRGSRCTRRSRSPRARPSCATTCGCCRGWRSGRCSCARPSTGRSLLEHALQTARARAAVGALPFVLNLIARDQATTDRWAVAEATYHEAIGLARESGQQTELAFGLAGLAWLQARRGREQECRALRRRGAPAVRGTRDAAARDLGDGGARRARARAR